MASTKKVEPFVTPSVIFRGKTRVEITAPDKGNDRVDEGPGWTPELDKLVGQQLIVKSCTTSMGAAGIPKEFRGFPQNLFLLFVEGSKLAIDARWVHIVDEATHGSRKGYDKDKNKISRGSRVLVTKPKLTSEAPFWNPCMDFLDGKKVVINKVLPGKNFLEFSYNGMLQMYTLNPDWVRSEE